jgi:hypothetical protein
MICDNELEELWKESFVEGLSWHLSLGTEKTPRDLRIENIPVEFQNQHLLNTSRVCYRLVCMAIIYDIMVLYNVDLIVRAMNFN